VVMPIRLDRPGWIIFGMTAAVATVLAASAARAASVKDVFEKNDLLGIFAAACDKPPAENNLYFNSRVLDASHVQRDQMSGPTKRDSVFMIDKASESKPNEIVVSGTRDGQAVDAVWQLEPSRLRQLDRPGATRETPWLNKCDPPRAIGGTWNSNWGPVTLQIGADSKVSGTWKQAEGIGTLKDSAYDPAARTFVFSMEQPWNRATGKATFKLSSDNKTLDGSWSITRADGTNDAGSWNLTR
jgi:hypothetical protein